MKKIIAAAAVLTLITAFLAGCSGTDVVLKYSPESFKNIVGKYPSLVTDNTLDDHYYYLTVDKETTLKISHDYELTGADDIVLKTPLKPFTDAGLDVSKLGSGYKVSDDMLLLTADYGNGTGMKDTVADSLFESVRKDRSVLTYHQKLDHYGIKLTAGKFEWAKDYTKNDKDIVFVIRAKPLKDLGVKVENIRGWTFTTVQDTDGSNVDVLLKAYDLDAK
ncbi:MAG: hypothetical protein Q8878_10640 [Bacillota bacterium]|nr:hypothetical protein [Bacillota bacterium]